jgi:hypothetical protein
MMESPLCQYGCGYVFDDVQDKPAVILGKRQGNAHIAHDGQDTFGVGQVWQRTKIAPAFIGTGKPDGLFVAEPFEFDPLLQARRQESSDGRFILTGQGKLNGTADILFAGVSWRAGDAANRGNRTIFFFDALYSFLFLFHRYCTYLWWDKENI